MRALWLVNQLCFIVPVNPWKNRASSELLYKSNRPQVSMVYKLINHLGCWWNTRRIRKSLACGLWFTNSSRVLPTSCVVYQPINHRNLWSITEGNYIYLIDRKEASYYTISLSNPIHSVTFQLLLQYRLECSLISLHCPKNPNICRDTSGTF